MVPKCDVCKNTGIIEDQFGQQAYCVCHEGAVARKKNLIAVQTGYPQGREGPVPGGITGR